MEGISLHNSNYQWRIVFDWCLAFPSNCLILLPPRRLQLQLNKKRHSQEVGIIIINQG